MGEENRERKKYNAARRVAEEAVAEIRARVEADRGNRERVEAEASAKFEYDMK